MFNRRKANQKLLTGIFIGSAAGSLMAFLFTPKTGKQLRHEIKDTVDTSLEKVKDGSGKIYTNAITATTDTMNKLQAAVNASINKYKSLSQEYSAEQKASEEKPAPKTARKRTTRKTKASTT
ncbi:MAG: YtxH domain-containing protein [Syntrophothermus sp.]